MQRKRKYCIWLFLGFACCRSLSAQIPGTEDSIVSMQLAQTRASEETRQSEKIFTVREIVIRGNKKTRQDIILREIPFKPGDAFQLNELVEKFGIARRQLMNTTLFHEAVVALKSFEGYHIDVLVEVKERWYIFPVPYFKPVDRNLNQWLIEQKASLQRVNYGGKLLYNNATGRNDKLKFWLINGYTRQLSFSYDRLYIDKKMKWGMNLAFAMGKNREINFNTTENKQAFLKDDDYIRNFKVGLAELTYRKAIKTRHRFGISYTVEQIADTVVKLNPAFFGNERDRVRFPGIYYSMTYYNLDYIPYPTKGYGAEVTFNKKGFNKSFNLWQLTAKGSAFWPVANKTFFGLEGYGAIKLPFSQPYFNRRLLGYNDLFLQGYEYYVIDGVAGGYLKASLTRKLVEFNIKVPGTKKLAPQRIPINIFGRIYGNSGYVHNPGALGNNLSNRMLYSSGVGVDISTIYDFTFRIDWSFNQIGQNGIFLHKKTSF